MVVLTIGITSAAAPSDPCSPAGPAEPFDPYRIRLWNTERDYSFRGQPPPQAAPARLIPYYTRCGTIPLLDRSGGSMWVDDSNAGAGTHYRYPRADMDEMVAAAKKRLDRYRQSRTGSSHKSAEDWLIESLFLYPVRGLRALVYGSMEPGLECLLIASGAESVTTVEYNRLTYDHPRVQTLTPEQLHAATTASPDLMFDVVYSVSSFDHDGLGRYGDPLCPDCDLVAMDSVRTLLLRTRQHDESHASPRLILTLPVGPDAVAWNLMRRYGPKRLPLMLEGWKTVERIGWNESKLHDTSMSIRKSFEPVFVLEISEPSVAVAPPPEHTEL